MTRPLRRGGRGGSRRRRVGRLGLGRPGRAGGSNPAGGGGSDGPASGPSPASRRVIRPGRRGRGGRAPTHGTGASGPERSGRPRARRGRRCRPGRAAPGHHPGRAGPARTTVGCARSSPGAGGCPTRPTSRPPPCPSPTGSSGRSTASCRPPAGSPRRPSTSGSPPCSPVTTCPTRRSWRPASTATGAWPARPIGSSPPTTCCGGRTSTARSSPSWSTPGTGSGCGPGSLPASRSGSSTVGRSGDWLEDGERRQGPPRVGRGPPRRRRRDRRGLAGPRPGQLPVRGRVDGHARRAAAPARARSSRRPTTSSASWSWSRSGPSSCATSWSGRPSCAAALEDGNWHILKTNHLHAFVARETLSLAELEPYLGLDPAVEHRASEQMPLFGG